MIAGRRMKSALFVVLGLAGGLLFAVIYAALSHVEPPAVSTWKESAGSSTMPGRRAYTLPLNNPDMVPAAQATYMKDSDVVLGVFIQGQARAYPWWLTSNYHVVNDTIADTPLLLTLCEVCGGAAAFRPEVPELPGVPLSFQICGISLGTIELMDFQTHSKWRPFLGKSFAGPLAGRTLENYPVLMMTWGEWKSRYPETVVVNGSDELRARPHGAAAGRIGDPELPTLFAATANLTDQRLARHSLVLGFTDGTPEKAYALPVSELAPYPGLFLIRLGDKPVLIAREGELAVTAFDWRTAPSTEITLISTNPMSFRTGDGYTWNAFGFGTAPGKPDRQLHPARSYLTEWYEWVSHSPQTEILQQVSPVRAK